VAAKQVYVGNLSRSVTEDALREVFSEFGTVLKVLVKTDLVSGRPRGFAFVTLESGADVAIQSMNGQTLQGRPLTVNEARPKTFSHRS
jgi:cold-inducible RNA-binding protein